MVEGRIRKYYEEVCLTEQTFIMDGENKVSQVIENAAKKIAGWEGVDVLYFADSLGNMTPDSVDRVVGVCRGLRCRGTSCALRLPRVADRHRPKLPRVARPQGEYRLSILCNRVDGMPFSPNSLQAGWLPPAQVHFVASPTGLSCSLRLF